MCMIDHEWDETAMLQELRPCARKAHRCAECRRAIEPGEIYRIQALLYEGRVERAKTCAHCVVACNWLSSECGGYVYSRVMEDIDEHVASGVYDASLADLYVAMRAQWRVDGVLLPVPGCPPTSGKLMEHIK